jgi:phosphatidylcholine synthase
MRRALAWGVHVYTASGALCGLLALGAIARQQPYEAFLWMFVAVAIDSTDGFLARGVRVQEVLPAIDGRRLDDMVDYFTWVAVPVAFMAAFGVLPGQPWVWALPLLASALGMSNLEAKTEDHFFLGFPSLWNVVALYLWVFNGPADINAAVVSVLALLVMVPTRYVYPSKTPQCKALTIVLMLVWMVQLLAAFAWPERFGGNVWMAASLVFPLYYLGLSIYLDRKLPRGQGWKPGDRV